MNKMGESQEHSPDATQRVKMLCGMRVISDPALCNPVRYRDRIYYFCNQFCLEAFQADPEGFSRAHKGSFYRQAKAQAR